MGAYISLPFYFLLFFYEIIVCGFFPSLILRVFRHLFAPFRPLSPLFFLHLFTFLVFFKFCTQELAWPVMFVCLLDFFCHNFILIPPPSPTPFLLFFNCTI